MVAYNKFDQTVADLAHAYHDLSTSAALKLMLTNTAPTSTMRTSTDITQISSGNGYSGGSLGGIPLPLSAPAIEVAGVLIVTANPVTLSASGGSIGPFRYAVMYNASTANVTGPLMGWFDHGSALTIPDGSSFVVSS